MKQQQISEDNQLITDFVGDALNLAIYGANWKTIFEMQGHSGNPPYHKSFDWLMPVVEKIERIHSTFHGYFGVYIHGNSCTIQGTKLNTSVENFHPAYFYESHAG